jgi:heat shock protein HslJ
MWQSIAPGYLTLIIPGLVLGNQASGDQADLLRYRGEYTYGHEVRSFCPDLNSQCYWIDGNTADDIQAGLQELVTEFTHTPYTPVCVVIEGRIDRETSRTGFAADYDGLVFINRLFGRCNESSIVTQGDLQHHRWVLTHINSELLSPEDPDSKVPELDFGERMTVTGYTGCNRLSGQAALRAEYFSIKHVASTFRACTPPWNEMESTVLKVLSQESRIRIDDGKHLILKTRDTTLSFRLKDWVK